MKQDVLPFQYAEEKSSTGMMGLLGLPAYLDLIHAAGLMSSVERHVGLRECSQGWTDSQMLRRRDWAATMVRTIYQQPSPQGCTPTSKERSLNSTSVPTGRLSTGRGWTRRPSLLQLPCCPLEEDLVQQPPAASQQGDQTAHRCGGHLP